MTDASQHYILEGHGGQTALALQSIQVLHCGAGSVIHYVLKAMHRREGLLSHTLAIGPRGLFPPYPTDMCRYYSK